MAGITSYATFTSGLAALSVTGVTRKFTEPPASIASGDLPASWPGLPSGEEIGWTFQSTGGWPTLRADLVIAVEAVLQNTQSANYAATVAIMDNLSAALRSSSIGRALVSWSITSNVQVVVADTTYWAVIATVEGR